MLVLIFFLLVSSEFYLVLSSFNDVSRKLKWCLTFQGYLQYVLRVSIKSFKEASRMFQGSFRELSRVFEESLKGISSKIEGCFR